jgi:hypothetical protein
MEKKWPVAKNRATVGAYLHHHHHANEATKKEQKRRHTIKCG